MASAQVYVGALSPEQYDAVVTTAVEGLDLTTAASVTFEVRKPSGTDDSWSADIVSATETELTLRHQYEAGDLDETGEYRVYIAMTVTHNSVTGPWRTPVKCLEVLGEFEGC